MGLISITNYISLPQKEFLNQKLFLPIAKIPIPMGKKRPSFGVISLYGTRSSSKMLKTIILDAKKKKHYFYRVDSFIDVGDIQFGKIGNLTLEMLPKTFFLPLNRITAQLTSKIWDIVVEKSDVASSLLKLIGDHPDRIDRIFQAPEFQHIRSIKWLAPLSDKKKDVVPLICVRSATFFKKIQIRNYKGPCKPLFP